MLLAKSDDMFPEGKGAPVAFHKDGAAAKKTSELLENATVAIKQLWIDRGYDPSRPERAESFSYTPPHPGASRQCLCFVCPCVGVWCLVVQVVRACCAVLYAVCPMCVSFQGHS